MVLKCSAVIPTKFERLSIRENIVKKFATSYGDHDDTGELYATYEGDDQAVIDALVQTFERYAEHSIEQT